MKYLKLSSPFISMWIFAYLLHITPKDADYIAVPLIFTGVYGITLFSYIAIVTLAEWKKL